MSSINHLAAVAITIGAIGVILIEGTVAVKVELCLVTGTAAQREPCNARPQEPGLHQYLPQEILVEGIKQPRNMRVGV